MNIKQKIFFVLISMVLLSTTALAAPMKAPCAKFTASPMCGPAPLEVQFCDESTGLPTNWSWDFGDGCYSAVKNPVHVYEDPGVYTVSLTVENCMGSWTVEKTITVECPM